MSNDNKNFSASSITLQSISEKLDQIIRYQKSARRWAVVKGIINFTLFILLVVAPMAGLFYLIRSLAGQVDLSKLSGQYQQAVNLLNTVGDFQGKMTEAELQKLIQSVLPK